MFEQVLLENQGRTRKPWTVCVSFLLQILMVGVLVMVPLIFTDVLPTAHLAVGIAPPGPPPPPPPPPPAGGAATPNRPRAVRVFNDGHLTSPASVPKTIAMIVEDPLPPGAGSMTGTEGGVDGGIPGGVLHSPLISTAVHAAPPPVTAPPAPKAVEPEKPKPTRIAVSSGVQEAKIINKVIPIYPPLARQARVQGTVYLTGVIGRDGAIQQLQVLSGHPLLIKAALEAVRQWRYRPTHLNGEPVEVIAPISVIFTLN